jgi:hypothetical protein
MGKKCTIYIFKDNCEWVFETRKDAAEFLNCSITSMVYNEGLGQRVKGYKVVFEALGNGCIKCAGTKSSKKDDYCSSCYYKETTGKEPFGASTPMGLNENRSLYNPQKRVY